SSLARELAGRGNTVTVIERAEPGFEASGAAAGLIAPQAEGLPAGPLFDLAVASRGLYPVLAAELAEETGIDVGWRRKGVLRCSLSGGEEERRYQWQRDAGLHVEPVGPRRIAEITGGLASAQARSGLFFPEDGIVDPRRLTRALWISAERRGARFLLGTSARRLRVFSGRCRGVETDRGGFDADAIVDATGAWAAFDPEAPPVPVDPVRGQIVDLRPSGDTLPSVVESEEAYLVPREDGSLLVGSTEERVGFRKEITAGAVRDLIAAACRLVPSLSAARFAGAWAGLRPGSADGLPVLGESAVPGLFFATGHFRNGILLAPVTARLMSAAVEGSPPAELNAFSPTRFSAAGESRTEEGPGRLFG
ncbi:MAG: glycine oxidase ThiO, partial [Acidobacteriota bacterium]|nr:glycine oxidase ThiO [Acidobacteriota bacterium]